MIYPFEIKEGVSGWVGMPIYAFIINAPAIPELTAKQKYKIKYHKERWSKRYKKKYPEISGSVMGVYSGCEIIID